MTPKYPHLAVDEAAVLDEYYREYPGFQAVAEYDYRLRVAEPAWPPHSTEEDREMWRALTAKRPDVVWRTPTERWVVEVTPRISKASLGGVLMYRQLLEAQEPDPRPIRMMIVTGWDDPGVRGVAQGAGVVVVVATPPAWLRMATPPPFDRPLPPGR